MRMRKRHNLEPRMEKCADLMINEPENMKGRWKTDFPRFGHIQLEIGCGKGDQELNEELDFSGDTVPDITLVADFYEVVGESENAEGTEDAQKNDEHSVHYAPENGGNEKF